MTDDINSRHTSVNLATGVWILLMAATVLSWWLAGAADMAEAGARAMELTAIIALAILKMYLVIAVFMGIAKGPANWHITLIGCLLAIGGVTLYFVLPT